MSLVDVCVERPVRVWVGVLLAAVFGTIAYATLPVQLAPTIDRPEITVETDFPGAAPLEVEQQLTDRIEERLSSVEGLSEMTSTSREGKSTVVLKFDWGTDKDVARLDVSEKLGLVKDLPDDVERSVVKAVNSDEESPIAWLVVETSLDPVTLSDEIEDVSKARIERLPGVGSVMFVGARPREVHVAIDLDALAARGMTVAQVRDAIVRENRNERGGTIEEGKVRWVVRTVGQFSTLDQLRKTVLSRGADGSQLLLSDVATVRFDRAKRDAIVRANGTPAIVMGVLRRTGANVVDVMDALRAEIRYQNEAIFGARPVRLVQVYDETVYIHDAKRLVTDNLLLGALLAVVVLLLFLRSLTSTLIVAFSIPVSLVTTFVVLKLLGRSLNIISLAGLAFASGMVVDNAIVVVENVFRHRRELGATAHGGARAATSEVWGALLASTLTTLAVFLPILFVQEEAGQLFRDIALAISAAVGLSLVVSVTLVPMLAARWLRVRDRRGPVSRAFGGLMKPLDAAAGAFVRFTTGAVAWLERGVLRRLAYLTLVFGLCVLAFLRLLPPKDYLPPGNRNLVISVAIMPAGYGLEEQDRAVGVLERRVLADPRVERVFSVVSLQVALVGALVKPKDASITGMQDVLASIRGYSYGIPGAFFFVTQTPIFRRGGQFVGGSTAEVVVRGSDLGRLADEAARVQKECGELPSVLGVRSSFDFGNPERQVVVDRYRASDLGLRVQDVADAVATLVDGTRAGVFREEGKERDLRLLGASGFGAGTEEIGRVRIAVPRGGSVPLTALARVEAAEGPTKVDHKDQDRSITLTVLFKEGVALDEALEEARQKVVRPARERLPGGMTIEIGGQARDLDRTWQALSRAFLLALLVIYLLMAGLFDSFLYPFVVMMTVPFAMTGGVIGIAWMHSRQPLVLMDVITMMGFVILAGTVVNNSILIVHQALNFRREGRTLSEALVESVRTRIRPIFMTVATTVLGMLPLVLTEGSGSELYRGLGAVVVGGLALSTLFTLTVTPALMSLTIDIQRGIGRVFRRRARGETGDPSAPTSAS